MSCRIEIKLKLLKSEKSWESNSCWSSLEKIGHKISQPHRDGKMRASSLPQPYPDLPSLSLVQVWPTLKSPLTEPIRGDQTPVWNNYRICRSVKQVSTLGVSSELELTIFPNTKANKWEQRSIHFGILMSFFLNETSVYILHSNLFYTSADPIVVPQSWESK